MENLVQQLLEGGAETRRLPTGVERMGGLAAFIRDRNKRSPVEDKGSLPFSEVHLKKSKGVVGTMHGRANPRKNGPSQQKQTGEETGGGG